MWSRWLVLLCFVLLPCFSKANTLDALKKSGVIPGLGETSVKGQRKDSSADVVLVGVEIVDGKKKALLWDKNTKELLVVTEGESVGNWKVVKITANGVVLRSGSKETEEKVFSDEAQEYRKRSFVAGFDKVPSLPLSVKSNVKSKASAASKATKSKGSSVKRSSGERAGVTKQREKRLFSGKEHTKRILPFLRKAMSNFRKSLSKGGNPSFLELLRRNR